VNSSGKRNLTPREAAEFLGCSVGLVYRLIQAGEVVAFPLRGLQRGGLRIPRPALENYERRQAEKYAEKNGIILRFVME
jgi:excisionase family DNA binding protein